MEETAENTAARRADRFLSTCEGKAPFDTYELAHKVTLRGSRAGKRRRHRDVYKCQFCHKYHLTEH